MQISHVAHLYSLKATNIMLFLMKKKNPANIEISLVFKELIFCRINLAQNAHSFVYLAEKVKE